MNTKFKSLLGYAVLIPALAACSLTPAYVRPDVAVPAKWDTPADAHAGETVAAGWWQRFGSAELDQLMSEALAANHDLAAAVSRIEQARASSKIARSALAPSVSVSASASRDRRDTSKAKTGSDYTSTQALLSVNYELDLWGGNAASAKAADARVAASVYDRAAIELVLQSDVAADYFQILALKDRLAIARKNLDAAQQLMSLVQVRFDNGAATALDVAQQRTTLLNIQADIPTLEQSLGQTQTALAVLLGRPPQGFAVRGQSLANLKLPAVDAGQPAALLERRPDIRTAEARLIAANADIGAARAALYPNISLSAAVGVEGILTGGTSTVASIAASLAQTIFDAGKRQGQVDLAQGARKELVEGYAQSVLVGLKEVEDSLIAESSTRRRSDILVETVGQAREAYRLATVRYQAGLQDLLTVLDSQRSQLSAEDNLVQAQLGRYTATINLFKALGGGWSGAAPA
jgi:NodT family efflux transporter outer membrane factor (OMF) lipoprotein